MDASERSEVIWGVSRLTLKSRQESPHHLRGVCRPRSKWRLSPARRCNPPGGGGGGDAILTVGGFGEEVFGVIVWGKLRQFRSIRVGTIRWSGGIAVEIKRVRPGIPNRSIKFGPPNQGGGG